MDPPLICLAPSTNKKNVPAKKKNGLPNTILFWSLDAKNRGKYFLVTEIMIDDLVIKGHTKLNIF